MPHQDQFYLGYVPKDRDDLFDFLEKNFGINKTCWFSLDDDIENLNVEEYLDALSETYPQNIVDYKHEINNNSYSYSCLDTVTINGKQYPIAIHTVNWDGIRDNEIWGPWHTLPSGVIVGLALTSRYYPAIIDQACPHGRDDAFLVDVDKIAEIKKILETKIENPQLVLFSQFY